MPLNNTLNIIPIVIVMVLGSRSVAAVAEPAEVSRFIFWTILINLHKRLAQ